MTILQPKPNILDKILAVLGKNREVIIPKDLDKTYAEFGPYVLIEARKESFIKALFRKRA